MIYKDVVVISCPVLWDNFANRTFSCIGKLNLGVRMGAFGYYAGPPPQLDEDGRYQVGEIKG